MQVFPKKLASSDFRSLIKTILVVLAGPIFVMFLIGLPVAYRVMHKAAIPMINGLPMFLNASRTPLPEVIWPWLSFEYSPTAWYWLLIVAWGLTFVDTIWCFFYSDVCFHTCYTVFFCWTVGSSFGLSQSCPCTGVAAFKRHSSVKARM